MIWLMNTVWAQLSDSINIICLNHGGWLFDTCFYTKLSNNQITRMSFGYAKMMKIDINIASFGCVQQINKCWKGVRKKNQLFLYPFDNLRCGYDTRSLSYSVFVAKIYSTIVWLPTVLIIIIIIIKCTIIHKKRDTLRLHLIEALCVC